MKRLILLALLCSACAVAVVPPSIIVPTKDATASVPTPLPEASPPVDPPDRYNFLLLGGDHTDHRIGTDYGDKTDVMLLVSIIMEDPVRITVVQFPRNFYQQVTAFDDMWLFAVYGREGFPGLHYYYQEVFGVALHGIAYINMDKFEQFVDGLGGIWEGTPVYGSDVLTGKETLEYLRDNENNWGCPEYDCDNRQFKVLRALAEKIKTRFHETPLTTARYLWDAYGGLFETDLSEFEQIHYIAELAWTIATKEYIVESVRLAEPTVVRGETPLEVRGLVPNEDLARWMSSVLNGGAVK